MVDLTDRERSLLITAVAAWAQEGCFIPFRPGIFDGDIEGGEVLQLLEKLESPEFVIRYVQVMF